MAAVISLMVLVAGSIELELSGCEDLVDRPGLLRQLQLEGADRFYAKAHLECRDDGWVLEMVTAEQRHRSDPLLLPDLRAASQLRVLALIIVERARSLTLAQPARVEVVAPAPVSRSLWQFGQDNHSRWRLTVGAATESAWSVGPLRAGAQIGLQRGAWGIRAGFGFRVLEHPLGKISLLAVTVEPELTVVCVQVSLFEACGGARLMGGYGRLAGAQARPGVTAAAAEGPILGGAGTLGFTLSLSELLALEADGSVGWLWAPVGTIDGAPAAALGGGHAAARLSLVIRWGSP